MTETTVRVGDEQKHKDRIEGAKLFFDTFKHISTLSTGSILLMATFLEKLFQNPVFRGLVVVAFLGFMFAVVWSVVAMTAFAARVNQSVPRDNDKLKKMWRTSVSWAILGFLAGLGAFSLFAVINLLR